MRLEEQSWKKGDPDPKALACYGVLWQEGQPDDPQRDQMWLRFVTGRPVSDITTQFLDWCCERLAAHPHRVFVRRTHRMSPLAICWETGAGWRAERPTPLVLTSQHEVQCQRHQETQQE